MSTTSFVELGLDKRILDTLAEEKYTTPTPIQHQAIPCLLKGRDLLGIAQTGTGKTAAFVLPILHKLASAPRKAAPRRPQALILAPTRELAMQIETNIRTYGQNLHLRQAVIFGGVGQNPQVQKMARGAHILVATTGRLLDLVRQGHVDLSDVTFFVLDEADRMLDMGFIRDIRQIASLLPKKRQSMLFSATMPADIASLAQSLLQNPQRIEVTPNVITVDRIDQRVYFSEANEKRGLLGRILQDQSIYRAIVFTRTKHRANSVMEFLKKKDIPAEAIHGNKSQGARQRALKSFVKGDTRVLVATDIAARGIDISDVTHVINFELPNEAENYVHRIGRTARAGADGIAISLCAPEERPYLRDIENLIGFEIANEGDRPQMAHIPKKPRVSSSQQRTSQGNQSKNPRGRKPAAAAATGNRPTAQKAGKPTQKRRTRPRRAQRGGGRLNAA